MYSRIIQCEKLGNQPMFSVYHISMIKILINFYGTEERKGGSYMNIIHNNHKKTYILVQC